MLAIVNGGPSDHWVSNFSPGVHGSVIIGVEKNKYTATEFAYISNQALVDGIWEGSVYGVYFSSTHFVFYIYPTERRVFLISHWRKAQVGLRSTSLCGVIFHYPVAGLKQTVSKANASWGAGDSGFCFCLFFLPMFELRTDTSTTRRKYLFCGKLLSSS